MDSTGNLYRGKRKGSVQKGSFMYLTSQIYQFQSNSQAPVRINVYSPEPGYEVISIINDQSAFIFQVVGTEFKSLMEV